MSSKSKRLERVAAVAPRIISGSEDVRKSGGHCIFATAVGLAVCRSYGIDAQPMSVEVGAMNGEMYDWSLSGRLVADRPDSAWGVGVMNDQEEGQYEVFNRMSHSWDGHLVIEVPKVGFLDLNSGIFSRPERQMIVPEGFFLPLAMLKSTKLSSAFTGFQLLGKTDQAIMMYRRSAPGTVSEKWKESGDWLRRKEYAGDLARKIIKEM
jgi:hypothetical protein|tara:strand:+ start:490 stop:1113 length:624 start_codon:yes stop_codon:yes gene_type:complete